MKKGVSLLLCVAMLWTFLTVGVVLPAAAEKKETVIFDGAVNETVATGIFGSQALASAAVQEALQKAVAENGAFAELKVEATAAITADLRQYGYFRWCLLEDTRQLRCRHTSDNGVFRFGGMTGASGEVLSDFGEGVQLGLCSDGPGVEVRVESLKLTATFFEGDKPEPATPSDGTHVLCTFTFEDENATSIFLKNGEYIGDIVEWPENSGNHCLRYTVNEETRTGFTGEHPLIWPVGVGDVLAAQDDVHALQAKLRLKLDAASSKFNPSAFLYPNFLCNDIQRTPAEATLYTPGHQQFTSAAFEWRRYSVDPPQAGKPCGVALMDELSLDEGVSLYFDNVSFVWDGTWEDVGNVFVGYPNGTPCELTDLARAPMPTEAEPTKTETATATATAVEPTATATQATTTVAVGDANGDGAVNMKDVLILRKFLADMAPAGFVEVAADTTGDGTVNMKDVLALRKYLAGLVNGESRIAVVFVAIDSVADSDHHLIISRTEYPIIREK